MTDKYNSFRQSINKSIRNIDSPLFGEINKIFETEMASLCEEGTLNLGNDHSLTGFALECRVKNIFKELDFEIHKGRDGMEDFVVNPPIGYEPSKPMIIEVKSSRKQQISRNQLRQLDDWVFQLSGEQEARKYGLPGKGGIDTLAVASSGLLTRKSRPRHHPTPHKGVFIFNGSIQTSFNKRNSNCLSPNDEDFVNSRDFCILPFNVLVDCSKKYASDSQIKKIFWEKVHKASGTLLNI